MFVLSSISTGHPNERPTHPVDRSRAPARPRTRRIRSNTRGASYDRIIRPVVSEIAEPKKPMRKQLTTDRSKKDDEREVRPTMTSIQSYRTTMRLRFGFTISFFG